MKNKIILYFLGLTAFIWSIYPRQVDSNTFTILRDAGTIIRGTLSDARIANSSVTKRGQLTDYSQSLQISSLSVSGTITSTSGFIGGQFPAIADSTNTFNLFLTTAQTAIDGLRTFRSTAEVQIDGYTTFRSTAQTAIDGLRTFRSTAEARLDGLQTFRSTAEARLDEVRLATAGFNTFRSTAETRLDGFQTFRSTAETAIDGLRTFRSTAEVRLDGFQTFRSTAEVRLDGFQTFRSTAETRLDGLQTFRSTAEARLDGFQTFRSTAEARLDGFQTFRSTAETRLDGLQTFRSTAEARLDGFQTFRSTAETRLDGLQTFRSTAEARLDGFQTFRSTAEARLDGFQTFRSTAETRLDDIRTATTTPISVFDEGTFQGEISSFNFTGAGVSASVTGGTATITITGGGINPYIIVIGTLGAIAANIDIASNNVDGLNEALRRLGAGGLTTSSTAGMRTIIYKDGVYDMSNSTIPSGITLSAVGSSSVFTTGTNASNQMFKVWGTLEGFLLDYGDKTFDNWIVQICTGGIIRKNIFRNTKNQLNSGVFTVRENAKVLVATDGANNFRIEGNTFEELRPIDGLLFAGDLQAVRIVNSSSGYFNDNIIKQSAVNTAGNIFAIESATKIFVTGNRFEGGGRLLNLTKFNRDIFIENNEFLLISGGDQNGYLNIGNGVSNQNTLSTGTISIKENKFITNITETAEPIILIRNNNNTGTIIDGNLLSSRIVTEWKFIDIDGTNVVDAVITNNKTFGTVTFLEDGGTTTKNGGNDNFNDGDEQ